jgi:hypothetical protein
MKKILFVFTLSFILAAAGYVFSAGYYGTTSGGSTEGLTLGTNATLTVSDAVNATITAPFGSGAFADTYDGTGVNITATSANITTLTAANATFTASNTTGVMAANVLNVSGGLRAIIDEDIEAASDTLSVSQVSGGLINNYGQNADATMTLPAIAAGYSFTVILGTTVAKYYRLDPNANDLIILDGVASTDGKYVGIASAVQGAAISCLAITTGASAYDWACYTISGAWAAE